MPATSDEVNRLLADYTVATTQLIDKKTYLRDGYIGGTWNKFKILETFSQASPQPNYVDWEPIPEELLPVKEDEVLIHTAGGTAVIDGVEVTQHDASLPAFEKGHKYLLVISLDPSTRIGSMRLGLYSTLPVNTDETLDPRNNQNYLQSFLRKHYQGSLQNLKGALKSRKSFR